MAFARLAPVLLLLSWHPFTAPASAQTAALTRDAEDGFRRLMRMAESGQLGADVTAANVGIAMNEVRVELVRRGLPSVILLLKRKSSNETISRYFDVRAGEGATPADVERVGKALDAVFAENPFRVPGLEESEAVESIPSLAEGWENGGGAGVVRVLERRMTSLASLGYTEGVIAALALGLAASVALLWGSAAEPRS